MIRSLCILAALLLACTALATPAPEPFVTGWGYPVNPDRDCKIRRDKGVLTIEMPSGDHDYDPVRERFNAPRILREIEGNFEIQVRVRIDCRPSAKSTVKGQPAFVAAGFLLIPPDKSNLTCARMEYGISQRVCALDRNPEIPILTEPRWENIDSKELRADSCAVMTTWIWRKRLVTEPPRESIDSKEFRADGYDAMNAWINRKRPGISRERQFNMRQEKFINDIWDPRWQNWPLPKRADYAYLRLEQRDEWFTFYISPDGEKWTRLNYQPSQPGKLKVGLAAYSTSSEPSKVIFDRLKLARGKKKEDKKE
jgi:hypothetical protein